MEPATKSIGEHIRRLFAVFTKRPLAWTQIDALASLEEREEALQGTKADAGTAQPERNGVDTISTETRDRR
jgi:hypothetical protein